jgi:stage V sporulation protein S
MDNIMGAVNQGIKGIAVARGYVGSNGYDLYVQPGFADGEIDGEDRTVIRMNISLK